MYKFYTYMNLPKKIADRVKGQVYINKKNKFVKWTGKKLEYMCECGKAFPTYNYEGETRPICCASCKEDTMVNVKDKKKNVNVEKHEQAIIMKVKPPQYVVLLVKKILWLM